MGNRKKGKGIKVVIAVFIVLILLVVGIFGVTYVLVSDADKKGNMLDGTWNYNNKQALKFDVEKKTYSLNVDEISESGNIVKVELVKDNYKTFKFVYKLTLDGNGTHEVTLNVDSSKDKKELMTMSSSQYNKTYQFEQIESEDK